MLPWGSQRRCRMMLPDILVLALPAGVMLARSCSLVPKIHFPHPLGLGAGIAHTCRFPSEREVSLTSIPTASILTANILYILRCLCRSPFAPPPFPLIRSHNGCTRFFCQSRVASAHGMVRLLRKPQCMRTIATRASPDTLIFQGTAANPPLLRHCIYMLPPPSHGHRSPSTIFWIFFRRNSRGRDRRRWRRARQRRACP